MYRVEIERADESVFFWGFGDEPTEFEHEEDADEIAVRIWENYGYTEKYARFSVVDGSGERVTDWEC